MQGLYCIFSTNANAAPFFFSGGTELDDTGFSFFFFRGMIHSIPFPPCLVRVLIFSSRH